MHHGDAVADAFGAEDFNGFADGFGPADFAGMAKDVQALFAGQIEGGAEIHGGEREFVAAHAESDHAGFMELAGPARHFLGGIGAELAGGIENPCGAETVEGDDLRGLADGGEIRFHVLHAAQHHAGGDGDFGVDHVLALEFFEKLARDERVVGGIAKKRSDPLEDVDEAGEIGIVVTRDYLFGGELGAVARGEFDGGFGADGAFKVEMKLGFRKLVEDGALGGGLPHSE